MGYFDVLPSKMASAFKFRVSMTSLLVFFKLESKNLVSLGYFDVNFSKSYIFPNSRLL